MCKDFVIYLDKSCRIGCDAKIVLDGINDLKDTKNQLKGYKYQLTITLKNLCYKADSKSNYQTPDFLRTPLGSEATIQPRRQPGISHLFDMDPTVSTGVTDPKIPIGKNLLFPKTM